MQIKQQKWFTLSVILNRVKNIFDDSISGRQFWLKVEISQIKIDFKGHYYIELVENVDGVVLAKCKANIWREKAMKIHYDLQGQREYILKEGSEILCLGQIFFSPVYGISINIIDIDLSYSLGEVERKKQQTIELITKQGLQMVNKEKHLPAVIQRIAIVGAVDSAGHTDFITQLVENKYGIHFYTKYFDTTVQGQHAVHSITASLNEIRVADFDCVVIIRGGGASLDLDVFNDYNLAVSIARFPIPVLTGIGHETDNTVADFVCYARFKTPSALAAYIVEKAIQFKLGIEQVFREIVSHCKTHLMDLEHHLNFNSSLLASETLSTIKRYDHRLRLESKEIVYLTHRIIEQQHSILKIGAQNIVYQPVSLIEKSKVLLQEKVQFLEMYTKGVLTQQNHLINMQGTLLSYQVFALLKKEQSKLEHSSDLLGIYDLDSVLMKGFAVVRHMGKAINANTKIEKKDYLEIQIFNKEYLIEVGEIKEITKWNKLLTKKHLKN